MTQFRDLDKDEKITMENLKSSLLNKIFSELKIN